MKGRLVFWKLDNGSPAWELYGMEGSIRLTEPVAKFWSEEEASLCLAAEGCRVGDPVYTSCSDVLIWYVEEEEL